MTVTDLSPSDGQCTFLVCYRAELIKRYDWARLDANRLDRQLQACEDTLLGKATTWDWRGGAASAAYRAAGGCGRISLKGLKAL